MTGGPLRCAAHPARPAVDRCPACDRPRCAADARAGDRCAVCATEPPAAERAVPLPEALTRGGLAALPVTLAGAAVVSEYVGSGFLAWATPFLLGVVVGAAVLAAAGRPDPTARRALRAGAVVYALLGTGYAYRFVPGHADPFGPAGTVLPAYAAAAAGACLWTLPRRRRPVSRRGAAAG